MNPYCTWKFNVPFKVQIFLLCIHRLTPVCVGILQCQEVQMFKLKEEIEETAKRLMFLLDYAKFPRKPTRHTCFVVVCYTND